MLVVNLPSVKRYKRHVVEGEPRYARWPRRLVVCARYTHTHTGKGRAADILAEQAWSRGCHGEDSSRDIEL